MQTTSLQRLYFFSDVYGATYDNPTGNESIEELITTDFRCPLLHTTPIRREFDIHHHPQCTDHILRSVLELYDESRQRSDWSDQQHATFKNSTTGIFMNIAPRISTKNGETPFVIATAKGGAIRIVCTGFQILSAIKSDIETLAYLPNPNPKATGLQYSIDAEHNGLYSWKEQFRSSFTPQLLDPNHGYTIESVDTSHIPDYKKQWHIAYIDRYGNVLTWSPNPAEIMQTISAQSTENKPLKFKINEALVQVRLEFPSSLGSATPGAHILYCNGGNIEITRKWLATDSPIERLEKSGYYILGKPTIGSTIELVA